MSEYRKGGTYMGDFGTYVEEQEERLRELASKMDLVKTRIGMVEDEEERVEFGGRLRELDGLMDHFKGVVEELKQAGDTWEDTKEGVEKSYLDVKDALGKASGGLIK
jgi:hypothetical protein